MIRKLIRTIILMIAHTFGTRIVDCKSGRNLGKVLIIPWRGKIHVIGLQEAVRPSFVPQKRLTYWKQELGFMVHDAPDFENLRQTAPDYTKHDSEVGPGDAEI